VSNDVVLAVITALKADANVHALAGDQIYRKTLPQNPTLSPLLSVTVSEVDDIADTDTNTSGYAHTRIQCTVWGISDGATSNLSKVIRKALHRTTNTVLPAGTGHVYITQIKDAGVVPDENTDISVFIYHRDFVVMYDYKG
jgi:hypothetical protein